MRSHRDYGFDLNQKIKRTQYDAALVYRLGVIKGMSQSKIPTVNQVLNIQNVKVGLGNNMSFK